MLRLLSLDLTNIGPFDSAHVDFAAEDAPRVTLITGPNGTGKSIVLDAIRGLFGDGYCRLERRLWRPERSFQVRLTISLEDELFHIDGNEVSGSGFQGDGVLSMIPWQVGSGGNKPSFVVDYWRSGLPSDTYEIQSLTRLEHKDFLRGSLQGTIRNAHVTELLCAFDYMRDSRIEQERRVGEVLYGKASEIIRESLLDGELVGIERSTFTPIVRQAGKEVPLANLSSGNAYLIQRMIGLLGKMYSFHVLAQTDPSEIGKAPGVLLIDEAENHLHPRWQKRFLTSILSVFPGLQIIATTHSPFIVASVRGARVYVCSYNGTSCEIHEETDAYASKPVDEILLSAAFSETQPFSEQITRLIEQRRGAIRAGDHAERKRIELQLLAINPEYFRHFGLEELIASMPQAEP